MIDQFLLSKKFPVFRPLTHLIDGAVSQWREEVIGGAIEILRVVSEDLFRAVYIRREFLRFYDFRCNHCQYFNFFFSEIVGRMENAFGNQEGFSFFNFDTASGGRIELGDRSFQYKIGLISGVIVRWVEKSSRSDFHTADSQRV